VQVEITLPHLESAANGRAAAAAVTAVAVGMGVALVNGGYDKLTSGLKQAAGVGLNVARQTLTRECCVQLLQLSALLYHHDDGDDAALQTALLQLHDEHFTRAAQGGRWDVTVGRWEPKANFATMLAELVVRRDGTSEEQRPCLGNAALLRRLCLGDDNFVGLCGMVTLGLTPGGDHQRARSEPMTRIATWAQTALSSLSDEGAFQFSNEGLEVLTDQLTFLVDTARAQLSMCAERVLAADAAVEAQGQAEARTMMQRASEVVGSLEATLHTLREDASDALPLLQVVGKMLRAVAGGGVGSGQAAMLRKSAAQVLACRDAFVETTAAAAASVETLTTTLAEGGTCACLNNIDSAGGAAASCNDAARCVKTTAAFPQRALPPVAALQVSAY
jgi:hypothetical protein